MSVQKIYVERLCLILFYSTVYAEKEEPQLENKVGKEESFRKAYKSLSGDSGLWGGGVG